MIDRNKYAFILHALRRSGFSRRTVLFGTVFIATVILASFVDVDALLRYYKIIGHGSPFMTLETAATISLASAVPFLAMGMSISADSYRSQRERE